VSGHGGPQEMTYVLKVRARRDSLVRVGRLGRLYFEKGFYYYVGSARRNHRARIARHGAQHKKLFWHIDHLLHARHVALERVLILHDNKECGTARFLHGKGHAFVDGFGSSDCRCPAHLFFSGPDEAAGLERSLVRRGFHYADKDSF